MSSITQRTDFSLLRYANVWEDTEVLLSALEGKEDRRFLSIASAGDNTLSLLTLNPAVVVAVDLSPVQLALLELKIKAMETLSHRDCIGFLGFRPCSNRLALYEELELSAAARAWLDERKHFIEQGIIHGGKFEKYFQLFARRVLPFIHSRKTVSALLSEKSRAEQEEFYHKKWNSFRWRILFKFFFSRWIMGKLGRDPEFLKEVDISVGDFMLKRAGEHLGAVTCQRNTLLRYQLTGSFGDALPHYLQAPNFEVIRSRLDRLTVFQGHAEEAIEHHGNFDAMNLSNIFEYMSMEVFEKSARELTAGLNGGGKLCYWNLMVDRRVGDHVAEVLPMETTERELRKTDRGFFYKGVVTERKGGE